MRNPDLSRSISAQSHSTPRVNKIEQTSLLMRSLGYNQIGRLLPRLACNFSARYRLQMSLLSRYNLQIFILQLICISRIELCLEQVRNKIKHDLVPKVSPAQRKNRLNIQARDLLRNPFISITHILNISGMCSRSLPTAAILH